MSFAPPPPPRSTVREIVARALAEDIGRGDVTSEACIEPTLAYRAELRARERLVFSGGPVLAEVFAQVDPQVRVELHAEEGAWVEPKASVATLRGSARSLLLGERVALNLLQRMCGVATLTRRHVEALPEGSRTRIADTRKTTPGLRALERYAVRCGGGFNHREDLSSAVLIKDNHVAAAGGVAAAIQRARAYAPHTSRIECEVDTEAQLREAVEAGAEIVLLDNFQDDAVARAVEAFHGKVVLEVSGGVTLERIPRLATMGVDVISVGALTHSARAADLGLDFEVES
ncbi:MAG: carboxylating nicotinate-nucleotide diphosphorylase [Myxococcales bacterium]|nr:carboxylating nicotinate-nucleotide diphosphorylase [Myxococcales bacterium]